MYIRLISIIAAFSSASIASAGECKYDDLDRAEYFSEKAAEKLVEKYGGGQDIVVRMNDCNYNNYSKLFKINVEIYWNGTIFRSNKYNVDGELKIEHDGSNIKFAQTYANEAVKDLKFWQNIAVGAVVLGAVAVEMSDK